MQDPIYRRLRETPRPTLRDAGLLLLLATAGLWLSAALASRLPFRGWAGMAVLNALYYLPFMLAPVLLCAARGGATASLRLNPVPRGMLLPVILLALMSVYSASALTYGWTALLSRLGLEAGPVPAAPESRRALSLAILCTAALPAVCEELLFRGVVLSAWESRGTRLALGATTALFALLHGDLYGWPAYLLVGGVAGAVTVTLDSLYAGITFHTVYNAACLIVSYAAAGMGETGAGPLTAAELAQVMLRLLFNLALTALLLGAFRRRAAREGVVFIPRIRRPLSASERLWLGLAAAAMAITTILQI